MKPIYRLLFVVSSLLVVSVSNAALDATSCGNAIVAKLKPLNGEITGTNETNLKNYWAQICQAIIDQIKNSAQVTVTGVQTGAGVATGTVQ